MHSNTHWRTKDPRIERSNLVLGQCKVDEKSNEVTTTLGYYMHWNWVAVLSQSIRWNIKQQWQKSS